MMVNTLKENINEKFVQRKILVVLALVAVIGLVIPTAMADMGKMNFCEKDSYSYKNIKDKKLFKDKKFKIDIPFNNSFKAFVCEQLKVIDERLSALENEVNDLDQRVTALENSQTNDPSFTGEIDPFILKRPNMFTISGLANETQDPTVSIIIRDSPASGQNVILAYNSTIVNGGYSDMHPTTVSTMTVSGTYSVYFEHNNQNFTKFFSYTAG